MSSMMSRPPIVYRRTVFLMDSTVYDLEMLFWLYWTTLIIITSCYSSGSFSPSRRRPPAGPPRTAVAQQSTDGVRAADPDRHGEPVHVGARVRPHLVQHRARVEEHEPAAHRQHLDHVRRRVPHVVVGVGVDVQHQRAVAALAARGDPPRRRREATLAPVGRGGEVEDASCLLRACGRWRWRRHVECGAACSGAAARAWQRSARLKPVASGVSGQIIAL